MLMSIAVGGLRIIFYIMWVVSAFWGTRNTIHMFQLNSYQYQAQGRYFRTHLRETLFPIVGIVLSMVLLMKQSEGKFNVIWGMLSVVYMFILVMVYRPKQAKKRLAITARVKRLIVTSCIIYLLSILLCIVCELNEQEMLIVFLVLTSVSPYVVLAANGINIPIERGIKTWYINDAKKILASCQDLKIVGITGSYGKTSVKYYLNTILSSVYDVLMTPESFNTPMGVVKTIREGMRATHQIFLCEMGARHVGDIKEICDIVNPHFGVITSLGHQHLETFKTIENIVGTKKELFDSLPQGAPKFVNGDNEFVQQYDVDKDAITYGLGENCTYRAVNLVYSEKGASFTVVAPDGSSAEFATKLLGEHNIVNVTGAIAISHYLGVPLEKMKLPVRRLQCAPHRLQQIEKGQITIIDDAYNSNPNGAYMALRTLGMFAGQRVLVTPGMVELGQQEDYYNLEFGKQATDYCEYIVLVGKKQTESIAEGVRSKKFPEDNLYIAENLHDALKFVYSIKTYEKIIVLLENDLPDNYL